MNSHTIAQNFYKFGNNYVGINPIISFFFGGSLCFVLEEKKYSHIPIVIFFPVVYSGYNIYKNRDIFMQKKIN